MSRSRPWTEEEKRIALSMRYTSGWRHLRGKYARRRIAKRLGRTEASVEGFLAYHRMDELQKQARAEREHRYKLIRRGIDPETVAPRIDKDAETDRSRRAKLAPRDLSAAFCGDPLPGYSALERRT